MSEQPAIVVRRATARDAEDIARILREAFAPYEPQYTAPAFRATVPDVGDITARFAEGPAWVALAESHTVGTVSAMPTDQGIYIRSMAVTPAAQGYGAGRRLLEAIESYARELNAARLYLSTTPFLVGAIRLYEAAGFRRCPGGPTELFGTPLFTLDRLLR